MNPAAVDIKDIIESEFSDLTFAENLFLYLEPAMPDDCVTIYDNPGAMAELTLNPNNKLYSSAVQVRARNYVYEEAWNRINDIRNIIEGLITNQNGTKYKFMQAVNDPQSLSRDENNRFIIIINFEILRK